MKKGAKMAPRIVIIVETCICIVFITAFATARIRLSSASNSIARLTQELGRTQKAHADAVAEIEYLRGAMQRLDATVKAANAAIDKVEVAHHERSSAIANAPIEWLSCPLPTGVCDAFGEYVLPAVSPNSDGTDATVRAAEN
jgi:septal ring factor EnvC (AmiA/AmiB activator)